MGESPAYIQLRNLAPRVISPTGLGDGWRLGGSSNEICRRQTVCVRLSFVSMDHGIWFVLNACIHA